MSADLVNYERQHGITVNYRKFSMLLRNENSHILGVLKAYTAFAEIYIEDMWVDSQYRAQGYGRRLIEELEKHFTGEGFNNINLCTSQFQAPDFYRKCGFIEEFVRVNQTNPQFSKSFFVKFFPDQVQTQGLISSTT